MVKGTQKKSDWRVLSIPFSLMAVLISCMPSNKHELGRIDKQ